MSKKEILDYVRQTPYNTNVSVVDSLIDSYKGEILSKEGGVGQRGVGENAETFNGIPPEKAVGKNSHVEGNQSYIKEYQGVTVSNVNAVEQTYEISIDINKDVFPHVMEFYQDGVLKHSFITRAYSRDTGFVVTSYSDISALVVGTYDIKLKSGFALKDRSHVEGNNNIANARESHAEGWNTMVTEWTDGNGKKIGDGVAAHAEGRETRAIGRASHAEGRGTKAIGAHSHAEGGPLYSGADSVKALGKSSHAEGSGTTASGVCSHAEGLGTTASGVCSHAEGLGTTASGEDSHAEGSYTAAIGVGAHAEGFNTGAGERGAHAEGFGTVANAEGAHAEGNKTIASSSGVHVEGRFNIDDPTGSYAHIVGNGKRDESTDFEEARSNAHTLDWQGNSWYQGSVLVAGKDMDAPDAEVRSDCVIIKSTTPGSTKRFKLSVDDTKTLKIEEVPASV